MHWPVGEDCKTGRLDYDYVETWHAMTRLLERGTVRHIGISNFSPHQLYKLMRNSKAKPAVHQMELHPYLQQSSWIEFHRVHGIAVTAYSPLGNSNPIYHRDDAKSVYAYASDDPPALLENEVLAAIAEERRCTTAQVALAWGMARGTSVIPKSSHVNRIEENFGALECPLSVADMARIKGMESTWLRRFNNPSKGWGVDLFDGLDGV
jgi:alcohol dehydrogenase (NADP+)